MPDEALETPENAQDTSTETAAVDETKPATESAEDSSTAETDNWEQRYNDLRPEFDRRNQLLTAAEGHQGPEAQMQALRQLGVEVEMAEAQEADDPEWTDPDERIDQLEAKLAEREEAEQEAHFQQLEEGYIDSTLSEIEGKEDLKLSDAETKIVVTGALANRLEDGRPDLQGAFDDLKGVRSAAAEAYRASKKASAPPIGSAGEEKIDFRDPDARRKFMADDFAARQAAGES
jgi:hypothetical protein